MICYLFQEPSYLIYSSDVPALLYYAQIPATLIALFLSFYVFWKGKHLLLNRLLFLIASLFSVWVISTLIAWTNLYSNFIIFIWSLFGLILSLIAISSVYFIYVFLEKKDVTDKIKIIFLVLLSPVLFFSFTDLNTSGFNLTVCDAFEFEHLPYRFYYTSLGILAMIWILILLIRKYRTSAKDFKKEIILMGTGIELFLFSFFGMEFIASLFTRLGIFPDSELELYGLFGMVIFMIYISILMVRFKTFSVKLLATQALVWGLVGLIGSQFFFIKTKINMILNGFTFASSIIIGYYLVRSVKKEIEQKEQLEKLNFNLKNLIKQRESLVHLVTHKVKGSFTRTKFIFAGILDGTFGEISEAIKKVAKQGLDFDNGGIQTVDLVLNAANLQNGLIKYDMKELNLKDIVLNVFEDKKLEAERRGLKLDTKIDSEEHKTIGDKFWLKEVVNNLVDNSLKYTKTGNIEIKLEKKNDKILLSVKDTGLGITEEDKKNLFTEGGRGKDSVKTNVDSTGYGLYTVKLVVEAHKGRVWAESEGFEKGSQFYVELPSA